jgi:hypothetical protein
MDGLIDQALFLCTKLRNAIDHPVQIGITGAKAPCKPVSTTLGNSFAISENVKLTDFPRLKNSVNVEALLDKGHETRDLGFVVRSCRTMHDFDPHLPSKPLQE